MSGCVMLMYCMPRYGLADPRLLGICNRKLPLSNLMTRLPMHMESRIAGRRSFNVSTCSSVRMSDFDPPLRMTANSTSG